MAKKIHINLFSLFKQAGVGQCQADSKMPYENKKGKKSILGSKLEFSA